MTSELAIAIENNNEDDVKYLVADGKDVNEIYSDGTTPLIIACNFGFINIVKILIENNADVNLSRDNCPNSLLMACYNGYLDIVIELLNHSAKLHNEYLTNDVIVCSTNMNNIVRYNDNLLKNNEDKKRVFLCRIRMIKEFMLRDLISCKVCNKTYSQLNDELLICSKCIRNVYCSVECQRQDWTEHKLSCEKLIKN